MMSLALSQNITKIKPVRNAVHNDNVSQAYDEAYQKGYQAGYTQAFKEAAENRAILKKHKHTLDLMPID